MRPRHAGFIIELRKTLEDGDKKIEVFYSIKTTSRKPIEVLPETLERIIETAKLPEPKQLVEKTMKKLNLNSDDPRVNYEFLIDEDAESYKVNTAVTIGNHTFLSIGTPKPITDTELRIQLRYALKILEEDKMIDDLFENLELCRMNEEEDDE
jgi:hypothetical protein